MIMSAHYVMIYRYERFSIDVVIKADHIPLLYKAVCSLPPSWRPFIHNTSKSLVGEAQAEAARQKAITDFVAKPATYPALSPTIEIVLPSEGSEFVALLELTPVANLETPFGKSNLAAGNFVIYAYLVYKTSADGSQGKAFLSDLCVQMKQELGVEDDVVATSISRINKTFNELSEVARRYEQSNEAHRKLAEALKEKTVRDLLIRTRQAREPSLANIAESSAIDPQTALIYLTDAEANGLVNRKFDLVCPKCLNPVARFKDSDSLKRFDGQDVTCPKCGTLLSSESPREVFFATEVASKLLDRSAWMSVLVKKYLVDLGIPHGNVAVEILHGQHEIDVAANIDGDLLLMELKDGRFSMGHAYSFVGKCSRYKPKDIVIIALEGFDPEVKDYIESTGLKPSYIESLQQALQELSPVLGGVYASKVQSLLAKVNWVTSLNNLLAGI